MKVLEQYVQDAIRTESRIEVVSTEYDNLLGVMQIFVAAGNMLDAIKKNVFYGKEIKKTDWDDNISIINDEVTVLDLFSTSENHTSLKIDPRLFHALIGIATESSELIEAVIKALEYNTDIDHVNVREELGDLNWYQAIAIDSTDTDWNSILDTNIAKLKKRYPDKFSSHAAINRDTDAERELLETHHLKD